MTCSPYPTFFCFFFFSFISLTKLSAIFLLCRGECNPPWWWWWQRLRSSVLRRDWIRSPAHINIPGHSLACSPQGKMNVSVLRDKRLDTDILAGRVIVEALGPWSGVALTDFDLRIYPEAFWGGGVELALQTCGRVCLIEAVPDCCQRAWSFPCCPGKV